MGTAEVIIAEAARKHGQGASAANSGGCIKPTCPSSLNLLERALRRQAGRERRRWRADLAIWRLNHPDDNARRTMTTMPDSQGRPTTIPDQWSKALQAQCATKYGTHEEIGDDGDDDRRTADRRQHDLLRRLDDEVTDRPSPELVWTWEITTRARASLNRQKSTGKGALSAEVLQALSDEGLWAVREMLKLHFETAHDGPMSWTHIRLYLLPKVRRPESWGDFRGICLLKVLSKTYMSGAMLMVKKWAEDDPVSEWNESLLFGFESHSRCEDLVGCRRCKPPRSAPPPEADCDHQFRREASVRLRGPGYGGNTHGALGNSAPLDSGFLFGNHSLPEPRAFASGFLQQAALG